MGRSAGQEAEERCLSASSEGAGKGRAENKPAAKEEGAEEEPTADGEEGHV